MKIKSKKTTKTAEPIDNSPSIETEDTDLKSLSVDKLIVRAGELAEDEEKLNAALQESDAFKTLKGYQTQLAETLKVLKTKMEAKAPADKLKIVKSGSFAAELSAAKKQRTVNDKLAVATALDEIQEGLAIELANFKITDLDKHLTGALQDEYIDTEHSGSRTLKVERVG